MGPRIDPGRSPVTTTIPSAETAIPEKSGDTAKAPHSAPPQPERSATNSSTQIAEHNLSGQMQASYLHSQIQSGQQVIKNPAKITQPAPPNKEKNVQQPAPNMQTIMTNSGMKGVHNPPTESELKTYYATKGPANELIAKKDYTNAAAEYRKLASAESNPAEKKRLNTVAEQLDVAQSMNTAKVKDLSFPPSQANVESYFRTMKGKPISEIKEAYQKYADAYFVHSELPDVNRGDVVYAANTYRRDGKLYESRAPQNWNDVTNKRDIHSDGRRIIDCEGYALIGQKCLAAAGFHPVEFSVMSRKDDPKTADDESFTRQHIMVTGARTINDGGVQKTEVAVISNGVVYSRSAERDKDFNFQQFQSGLLFDAYGDTYREVSGKKATVPGGMFVVRGDSVTAEFDLLQILKSRNRPVPK